MIRQSGRRLVSFRLEEKAWNYLFDDYPCCSYNNKSDEWCKLTKN